MTKEVASTKGLIRIYRRENKTKHHICNDCKGECGDNGVIRIEAIIRLVFLHYKSLKIIILLIRKDLIVTLCHQLFRLRLRPITASNKQLLYSVRSLVSYVG